MHNFKELKVWQKSRAFVKDVYVLTSGFPSDERFGITTQFRRASVSIPLNIAEGAGKSTDPDFCRFLDNAFGSAVEAETLLYLSHDLGFKSDKNRHDYLTRVVEIQKMIHSLIQKLRKGLDT